ncbi:hypothetical protein T265_02797 [Opisthorchis viverrini]|uniref:Uncharacterized protein n=1 Tax=Opisthorchis viverrini TaxID=6198 RepID=A0A075A5I0_OPIVI|nr:hypothetical protein T265_02797 [Opisthorchis viverrini]KER30870.1 hypothetical protein T265_02797 [Opisthorchis viverrini]
MEEAAAIATESYPPPTQESRRVEALKWRSLSYDGFLLRGPGGLNRQDRVGIVRAGRGGISPGYWFAITKRKDRNRRYMYRMHCELRNAPWNFRSIPRRLSGSLHMRSKNLKAETSKNPKITSYTTWTLPALPT